MAQYRTIEVDFDVHKCIESERRGFDDTPNDALRRLLNLGDVVMPLQHRPSVAPQQRPGWSDKGVTLPHGTSVRMDYNNRTYEGKVIDGLWVIDDKYFDSPSGAASGVALTKKGKTTRLDGWAYWKAKLPGEDKWIYISSLRQRDNNLDDLGL